MLQGCGLLCLVTGAAFFSVGVAFVTAGVGLVLWGVSVEREYS